MDTTVDRFAASAAGMPPWAQRASAASPDALHALLSALSTQEVRALAQPQRFRYERCVLYSAGVIAGQFAMDSPFVMRGQVLDPTLHLVTSPGSQYQLGRRVTEVDHPSQAVLLPAGVDLTRRASAGGTLSVCIRRRLLQAELDGRTDGCVAPDTARVQCLTLDGGRRSRWGAAVSEHAQASRPGGDPGRLARIEAELASLLVDLMLPLAPMQRPGTLDAARLALVEDWIDAHLTDPITLGRLAAVAGVGARCLQKSFEARRGLSPMRFVAERRLIEAHRRLSLDEPVPTVKAVALDLGFHHLGRFAIAYRQLIGEAPSATRTARAAAA